jgi:hypothetical protein
MADNDAGLKNLKLECPYCGGDIQVSMGKNEACSDLNDSLEIPMGYECVKLDCWAEWDLTGSATSKSMHSEN